MLATLLATPAPNFLIRRLNIEPYYHSLRTAVVPLGWGAHNWDAFEVIFRSLHYLIPTCHGLASLVSWEYYLLSRSTSLRQSARCRCLVTSAAANMRQWQLTTTVTYPMGDCVAQNDWQSSMVLQPSSLTDLPGSNRLCMAGHKPQATVRQQQALLSCCGRSDSL